MPSAFQEALAGSGSAPASGHKKKGPSQSAFDELKAQVARKGGKLKAMAENGRETAMSGIHFAEATGTTFAVSMAKGAWGADKLKWGKVPLPTVVGLGLVGWGLWDELNGADGGHQIAFGTGAIASDVADLGREAGAQLAESWGKKDGATPAKDDKGREQLKNPDGTLKVKADGTPAFEGPIRELEVGRHSRDEGGGERQRAGRTHEMIPASVLNFRD